MEPALTISVVLYRNDSTHITELCDCLLKVEIPFKVFFFDNSEDQSLSGFIPNDDRFVYLHSQENLGYGRGHNQVIYSELAEGKYHLVVNADVYFDKSVLEKLQVFMDQNGEIGLVLPRILHPNGHDQFLYKLLPTPLVMVVRRFVPNVLDKSFYKLLSRYEMSDISPDGVFEAPYLSGCFMFLRKEAIRDVGGFDDRFFLYFEDVDFSRRIGTKWKTVYNGSVSIFHYFQKGSYGSFKLMCFHIISAIKYFNKHGWLDQERKEINHKTLKQFTVEDNKRIAIKDLSFAGVESTQED